MQIVNAVLQDIDAIFHLYNEGRDYQKTKFDKHWQTFDVELVEREIDEGRFWKIVEDQQIACIFTVFYKDPVIWGPDSGESAMYIHRIVTSSDFRGRGYARVITEWTKEHAKANGLRYVRMDTWGDNQKLIDYYQDCGFRLLGITTPNPTDEMPLHYRDITLSLFEIDLQTIQE